MLCELDWEGSQAAEWCIWHICECPFDILVARERCRMRAKGKGAELPAGRRILHTVNGGDSCHVFGHRQASQKAASMRTTTIEGYCVMKGLCTRRCDLDDSGSMVRREADPCEAPQY